MKCCDLCKGFFGASLISVGLSLYNWYGAEEQLLAIFTGLWAPTLMGIANYIRLGEQSTKCKAP